MKKYVWGFDYTSFTPSAALRFFEEFEISKDARIERSRGGSEHLVFEAENGITIRMSCNPLTGEHVTLKRRDRIGYAGAMRVECDLAEPFLAVVKFIKENGASKGDSPFRADFI